MTGDEEDSGITKETPNYSPDRKQLSNKIESTSSDEIVLKENTSTRTLTGINKAIKALGNTALNLNPTNKSLLEDTPEGNRDLEIRRRIDIQSKTDVLQRFQEKDLNIEVELPFDLTQTKGILLNNNDTYQPELLDTPLKNKISIRSLRNAKGEVKAASEPISLIENINSSPEGHPQPFIMTLKDADNGNILGDIDTQNVTQTSNEMLVPATNSANVSQTQEIRSTLADEKMTQLIRTQSNNLDVSESLLKLDEQSALQETSIVHTSPINFGSFHHSLLPSTRTILTQKETGSNFNEEIQLVHSPAVVNLRPMQQASNKSPSTVFSEEEREEEKEDQEVAKCHSSIEMNNESSQKEQTDENSSEMKFKLTYYVKPSSQISDEDEQIGGVRNDATDLNQRKHNEHNPTNDVSRELSRLDTDQEYEQTQELPEIFERNECKHKPSFESQEQLNVSKKPKNKQLILEEEFEDSSTPSKMTQFTAFTEGVYLPKELRISDEMQLTKKDVLFNNAVWYYFNDCNFYPGKILSEQRTKPGYCSVLFEKRQNDVRVEDIYYLDIRCGDKVHWKMNEYQVVALDCQIPQKEDVIRCIRGYDTVHLRKVLRNGRLSKNDIVDTIASIYVTTGEWIKRTKIKLEDEDNDPLDELRRSVRSRSVRDSISPMKKTAQDYNKSTSEIFRDTFYDTTIMSGLEGQGGSVFEKCIFVLSGLNDMDRKRLSYLIEIQGGYVSSVGFESLLRYEDRSREFSWNNPRFNSYRFGCLIAGNFSRSPKYLEALALGWPVLHWRFIESCINKGYISTQTILQNLLPSGESNRLMADFNLGIIKSSNVFSFLTNFNSSLTLDAQLNNARVVLEDYSILILGDSDMNFFVDFIFQVFKVGHWEYTKNLKLKPQQELDDDLFDQLVEFRHNYHSKKMILFINETSLQNSSDWENSISKRFLMEGINDFRIKNKEWLVQTVINEEA